MGAKDAIINVNEYDLTGDASSFVTAITALAERTKREGHPGVTAYRWYLNEEQLTAGAVIMYENAAARVGHHELAYQREEIAALQGAISPRRLVFMGAPSDEIKEWVGKANLPLANMKPGLRGSDRGSDPPFCE